MTDPAYSFSHFVQQPTEPYETNRKIYPFLNKGLVFKCLLYKSYKKKKKSVGKGEIVCNKGCLVK